jgi:hypothetical protein
MGIPPAGCQEFKGSWPIFRNRKLYVRSNAKLFQKNRSMDAYTAAREYPKSAALELLAALEARPRAWLGTGNRRLYRQVTYDYPIAPA